MRTYVNAALELLDGSIASDGEKKLLKSVGIVCRCTAHHPVRPNPGACFPHHQYVCTVGFNLGTCCRAAVERATAASSMDEGAWAMRRAFDAILSGAVAAQERAAALVAQAGSLQPGEAFDVISFENGLPIAPRWRILDDVVSSRLKAHGTWDAVFPVTCLGLHGRGSARASPCLDCASGRK